jgi:hypothetical protein
VKALARAVMTTSGRAAAVRAVPLFGAIAMASMIIFAGHGLRASDVVTVMRGSLGVRACMWLAWIALATPAVASTFDAPGTRTLRAIARAPRDAAILRALVLAIVIAVQAPMIMLFARGAGALDAIASALIGASACASAAAIARSRRAIVALAITAAFVAIDHATFVVVPAALLAWLAVREAWRSAFEQRGAVRIVRRSPPAIALASAYVARMIRSARGRLQSAAIVVYAGGGALALTLRNDPDARPVQRALVVLALPISIACALLAAPAIETEARLVPVLRATRTRGLTLACATVLALVAPSTAFAGTASALAAVASRSPHTMTLASIAWAALIASAIGTWARRASRARRSSAFLVGVVVIASVFTAVAASC